MRWLSRKPSARKGKGKGPAVRRRPRSRLHRLALLWGSAALLMGGLIAGGWWLTYTGWTDRMLVEAEHRLIEAARGANLTLRQIQVEGRRETSITAIRGAVQVAEGDPILSADPAIIKRRLERLAWVKTARVERRLPDTLYLYIEEHEPMAIWQREHKQVLISRTGKEIERPRREDFERYLVVVGDDAPVHTAELLEMLAKAPELDERVKAAVRVGGRRWDLHMDNGVEVRLPEEGTLPAWLKLARLQRQHKLLERAILHIDLRLPNPIVELTPEAKEIYFAPKDST
jgi:cell division protein FtsQ